MFAATKSTAHRNRSSNRLRRARRTREGDHESTLVRRVSAFRVCWREVQSVFGDLSGIAPEQIPPAASFLEIGFDSLLLTQASQHLQKEFGIRIAFRELMGDASTPGRSGGLPRRPAPARGGSRACCRSRRASSGPDGAPTPAAGEPRRPRRRTPGRSSAFAEQLRVMSRAAGDAPRRDGLGRTRRASPPRLSERRRPAVPARSSARQAGVQALRSRTSRSTRAGAGALTDRQQQYLSGFIERYTRRTPKSKTPRAGAPLAFRRPARRGGVPARLEGDRLPDRRDRARRARASWTSTATSTSTCSWASA